MYFLNFNGSIMLCYSLDGTTTNNNYTALVNGGTNPISVSTISLSAFGISKDGSQLYFLPYQNPSSSITLYTINSSTGTHTSTTFTNTTTSQKFNGLKGKIINYTVGGNFLLASDYGYHTVWLFDLNAGTVFPIYSATTVPNQLYWTSDGDIWNDGTSDWFMFGCYGITGSPCQVGYFKLDISLPITGMTQLTTLKLMSTPGFAYTSNPPLVSIDQNTNTLFICFQNNVVYQTTISQSSGVLSYSYSGSSNSYTISGDSSGIKSMQCNSLGGDEIGNIRLFVGVFQGGSTMDIYKLYNSSSTHPIGVSLGGDPKVVALNGKEVLITPEEKFLFLSTEKVSKYKCRVMCDSFTLGKNINLISDYQRIHVANEESFLKTFYLDFEYESEKFSLEVDCIDLQCGLQPESKYIVIHPKIECNNIPFSEYPKIRSRKYLQDLISYRRIVITTEEWTLDFEFIRTKCINYSDINLRIERCTVDVMKFSGVAIDGNVIYV